MVQTPTIPVRGAALFVETDHAYEEIPNATNAEVGISGALMIYTADGGFRLYAPGYWLSAHTD